MFIFSLFSSQLPYIVISSLYMLYFILSLGNKNEIKEPDTCNQEKQILHSAPQVCHTNTINYFQAASECSPALSAHVRVPVPAYSIISRFGPPFEQILTRYKGFDLFSRPPPVNTFI